MNTTTTTDCSLPALKVARGVAFKRNLEKNEQFLCGAYFWPPRRELLVYESDRLYSMICPFSGNVVQFLMELDMVMDDVRTVKEVQDATGRENVKPNAMPLVFYNSSHPYSSIDRLLFVVIILHDVCAGEEVIVRSRHNIQAFKREPPVFSNLAPKLPPLQPLLETLCRGTLYEGMEDMLALNEVNDIMLKYDSPTITSYKSRWTNSYDGRSHAPIYHQHTFRNRVVAVYYEDDDGIRSERAVLAQMHL